MARFKDFPGFAAKHPDIAEMLQRRHAENSFLQAMWEKAHNRKNFSPKMIAGLRKWTGGGASAPSPESLENMPAKGSTIKVTLPVTKVRRALGRYGVRNTFSFGPTADGWRGRLESNSDELENALDADHGFIFADMPVGETRQLEGPWHLTVTCEVKWTADKRPFVILGGRRVRFHSASGTAGPAAPATPATPEPTGVERRRAGGKAAEVAEVKGATPEPATPAAPALAPLEGVETNTVAGDDWRKLLEL